MLKKLQLPVRSEPVIPLSTRLGPVHLAITDPERVLPVWTDIVGLAIVRRNDETIELGIGNKVLIVLEPGAVRPVPPRTTGLYHVAIHVPERSHLARVVARAINAGVRVSPTDHLVSEAAYLWDADGNGIEITFETPWRGTVSDRQNGVYAITTDGKPHSGRERIDLDDLFAELQSARQLDEMLPGGARIGHVHVHVRNLEEAMVFYRDALGFGGTMLAEDWGMGDVSLDYMPHTLAFNIWQGHNAAPPPAGAAGLRHFTIILPDAEALDALKTRLDANGVASSEENGILRLHDPSGNPMHVVVE